MTWSSPASWHRCQDPLPSSPSGCLLEARLLHVPGSPHPPKREETWLVLSRVSQTCHGGFFLCKPSPFSLSCFRFSESRVCFIWSSLILRTDSLYVIHLFFSQVFIDHLLHVSCCSVPYQHFRFSRFLDKFITILQFILQKTCLS